MSADQTRERIRERGDGQRQETYYRLLNVAPAATSVEITRAYRDAIKRAHPDRALPELRAQAEEITKELNRAYGVLSDAERRRAYDRTIMQTQVQDQLMNRYVSGLGGTQVADPFAANLKREMTRNERRDRKRSDRNAMVSLLSAFVVILVGAIGLLLLFALASWLISLI